MSWLKRTLNWGFLLWQDRRNTSGDVPDGMTGSERLEASAMGRVWRAEPGNRLVSSQRLKMDVWRPRSPRGLRISTVASLQASFPKSTHSPPSQVMCLYLVWTLNQNKAPVINSDHPRVSGCVGKREGELKTKTVEPDIQGERGRMCGWMRVWLGGERGGKE